MRQIVVALAVLLSSVLLSACAGFDTEEIDPRSGASVKLIQNDLGGDVLQYESRFRRWAEEGARAKVDGLCASACTLVLGFLPPDRICLTRRARFGFHGASPSRQYQVASLGMVGRSGGAGSVAADLTTLEMYQLYPDWLQQLIAGQSHRWGGRGPLPPSNSLLIVGGGRFRAQGYPAC